MRTSNRILLPIIVSLALLAAACDRNGGQGGHGNMPPPGVTVATVQEQSVIEAEVFTGRLEAVDAVDVRSRVTGYIDSVRFKQGAMVNKGDVLFVVDPRPIEANVARAEAESAAARTRLDLARKELARTEQMLADNAVSRQEYDQRQAAVRDGEANVRASDAQLQRARLDLGFTQIKAPISGRVGKIEVTPGNLIMGEIPNSPVLTTIVAVKPIYAEFEIDERVFLRFGLNKPGKKMPVTVGLATDEGFPYKGELVFVDNRIDSRSGTARMRALLPNADSSLTPGLFARVRIADEAHPRKAVVISDRAIGTDQSRRFVLVVDKDNKANYREVKLGRVVDGLRVIESGLTAGETIVVNGMQNVMPGSPVTPQQEGAQAPGQGQPPAQEQKPAEEKQPAKSGARDVKTKRV